jgi:gas vesicle protein
MNNNGLGALLVGLLLGAIIGFFAGYKYAEHYSRENNTIRFELRGCDK